MKPCIFSSAEATALALRDPGPSRLIEEHVCPSVAEIDPLALKQVLQSGEPAVAYLWRGEEIISIRPDQTDNLGDCNEHEAAPRCWAVRAQMEGRLAESTMEWEEALLGPTSCNWRELLRHQFQDWENYFDSDQNILRDSFNEVPFLSDLILISFFLIGKEGRKHVDGSLMRDTVCRRESDCNAISTLTLDLLWRTDPSMAKDVKVGQLTDHSTIWVPTVAGAGYFFDNGWLPQPGDAYRSGTIRFLPPWQILSANIADIGVELSERGDFENATAAFYMALKIDPQNVASHYNFGKQLEIRGAGEGAIAEYRQALEVDPKFVSAHINLGSELLKKNDVDAAIEEFHLSLAIDPNNLNALSNLGVALVAKGDYQKAISILRRALEINPQDKDALLNLGVAFRQEGKIDEAISIYHRILALDSRDSDAYINLAIALSKRGDREAAVDVLHRAIWVDPLNEEVDRLLKKMQKDSPGD